MGLPWSTTHDFRVLESLLMVWLCVCSSNKLPGSNTERCNRIVMNNTATGYLHSLHIHMQTCKHLQSCVCTPALKEAHILLSVSIVYDMCEHADIGALLFSDAPVLDKKWKSDLWTEKRSSLSPLICQHRDEETWEEASWQTAQTCSGKMTCQAQVTCRGSVLSVFCFVF